MSIVHIAFYPSDWLAGTRGLSAEESGVYITLVCRMYEMAGPIERDDQRLSRLCGCRNVSAFRKALEYLISEGKIIQTGTELFNDRAEKEIENATSKSEKARSAAERRWEKKTNKNNGSEDADGSAEHMPHECYPESESGLRDTNVSLVTPANEISEAVSVYNEAAERVGWPRVQKVTSARHKALKARMSDVGGIEGWRHAIERAEASPFLTGDNDRGWRADFDFLCKSQKFTKLMEGGYDGRNHNSPNDDPTLRAIASAARAF